MHNPILEVLESRRLLSAGIEAHINFQPADSTVPSGYVADSGAAFGDRGNGLSYGWNAAGTRLVDRNLPGVDPRYDTFAIMNARGRGSAWQIALPDGTYQVTIAAGDPKSL